MSSPLWFKTESGVISFPDETTLWRCFESMQSPRPTYEAIAVRHAIAASTDAYELWEFFNLRPAGGIC
jgi:hypothetical protein